MARKLTASDRKSLIRLASTMPKGSPERKAILAGLVRVSATDGWGPASDGKVYGVAFMRPQASNFNTGPWVTGFVRGVRGSGFAIEMSEPAYNRVVSSIRRKAGGDFNEANKMMFDHFSRMNGAAPYDPNTGSGPWDG